VTEQYRSFKELAFGFVLFKKYSYQGREKPQYQRKEMQDLLTKTNYVCVFIYNRAQPSCFLLLFPGHLNFKNN